MSQAATYPRSHADGNQNAPDPQNRGARPVDPYGAVPQGYQSFIPPLYDIELEPILCENPCYYCCGVLHAARTLAVFNLIYLVLEIFDIMQDMVRSHERGDSPTPLTLLSGLCNLFLGYTGFFMTPGPEEYDEFNDWHFLYICKNHQSHLKDWSYIMTQILLGSNILAYLVATTGFTVAVVCRPGLKFDLLWSNIFMWMSFIYAGSFRFLFLIQFGIISEQCEMLHAKFLIFTIPIVIHSVYNGLLARGFRIMVQRESWVQPQLQVIPGIAGNVQATRTMPVTESIQERGESSENQTDVT